MIPRVALVSLHSHDDRSFLDDRILALVAGDLRADGFDADLVLAVLDPTEDESALDALVETLGGYGVVVYERIWSRVVIESLRRRLDAVFVSCEGEHSLDDPPAEFVCAGDLRTTVPALLAYLSDSKPLPRRVRARTRDGWAEGLGKASPPTGFAPVLHPLVVGTPALIERRTFSIEGNAGCPYGADARDNPVYQGVQIPDGLGRGCAFCTTGNRSESSSSAQTAEKVMAQLRYVRTEAPELTRLVIKDQNPFGWLTEVIETCADEALGGFSLLLETRADWFLRNQARFERTLEIAGRSDITLCPFLVGIESFSQAELDRFNKGTSAEANELFLETLFAWDEVHGALDLSHAAFGFVLLTPWTRMADLRQNLEAVERTGFHRLRGHLLVSKARLYPDTALYYLAARDGLLVDEHSRPSADNALRYGYFPEAPWRFADPEVARFADVAAELTARRGGHDELTTWRALLAAFAAAEAPGLVNAGAVERRLEGADGTRVSRTTRTTRGSERGPRTENRRDATVRLGDGCDAGCPLCLGTGPMRTADAIALAERGGGRLTLRGSSDGMQEVLRSASGWRELRVHTHAMGGEPLGPRVRAVLVPLFSHVDVVHDRIVGREGGLQRSLRSIATLGAAGVRVDVEIPLLPRRLAHPLSILRRVRSVTDALRSVRFVIARGRQPRSLMPPRWSDGATMLDEALSWCAEVGIEVRLNRDDAIPFCALAEYPGSLGTAFSFDPRRRREPAWGCERTGPCATCACEPQCAGVVDTYRHAHGFADIRPLESKPRALYDQRTTPLRVWTESQRQAARSTELLVLRPTVNCNQDCLFCSANETSANLWNSPATMYEQIARAARRGVERLAFGGGEPTLSRDLADYVATARRAGIEEVELVTNGTLLDHESRVIELSEAGLTHAFVSLHAHDEALSRQLTQKEGDFERTVFAIELLRRAGVKTAINHVITTKNYRYLPAFVRFVHERFDARVAISFAFVTPQYKALENFELVPRMAEVRPFVQRALAEAIALGQPCWVGARQGLPPCQLGAFRAWSDIFEHADAGLSEDAPQKVRGPQCERCAYTVVCTGVWRPYADRFGLDELKPIEFPPFGGRERVIVDDLKTERWGIPPPSLDALPGFLRDRAAEAELTLDALDVASVDAPFSPTRTRPLRVALVGSSARARQLAESIRSAPDLSLDAVISPHAPDAPMGAFGGCPRWRDLPQALEQMRPDALVIAADPGVQTQLACLGLEQGLPVLLARPVSGTSDEVSALIESAASKGVLVPAHELLHAAALERPTALSYRVGRTAPPTWSRRTLRPHLEDLLALAVKLEPGVELLAAHHQGAPRPEGVRVQLAGTRTLELELDLGPGEPRLISRGEGATRIASGTATDAMVLQFASVVAGRAEPMLELAQVARVGELVREVLDALCADGVSFGREGEPRHVASSAFRGRDE